MKVRDRTQLVADEAPPKRREEWAVCSGCLRARRVEGAVMVQHRAWVPALQEMVPCPGTDLPPAWVTAAQ